MATKTFVTDKDGATADASSITLPSDRHFRNAWKLSGAVMTEDLTAAKVIFKDKIREVRKPLLEAQDVAEVTPRCTPLPAVLNVMLSSSVPRPRPLTLVKAIIHLMRKGLYPMCLYPKQLLV